MQILAAIKIGIWILNRPSLGVTNKMSAEIDYIATSTDLPDTTHRPSFIIEGNYSLASYQRMSAFKVIITIDDTSYIWPVKQSNITFIIDSIYIVLQRTLCVIKRTFMTVFDLTVRNKIFPSIKASVMLPSSQATMKCYL